MLSQLSMLYFFKIGQWWEQLVFLSSVLMTCLYRDCSGFSWEIPACDHVVKQYIICDNIIECIYILAASGDNWHLMLLKCERLNFTITNPFHLGLEWEPIIYYNAKVFIFCYHLQLLPCYVHIWWYCVSLGFTKRTCILFWTRWVGDHTAPAMQLHDPGTVLTY